VKQTWVRRRWYDFRNGHSLYLIFILTFSNFVLIFHRLLIERIPFLDEVFSQLWVFVIGFVLIYIPLAVLIGHWHKRTQLRIDTEMMVRQNPLAARCWRVIIDLQTGKASEKDVDSLRELLKSIEKGQGIFDDSKKNKFSQK